MDSSENSNSNNTSSQSQYFEEQSATSSIVLTVVINGIVCIVLLTLFIALLRRYVPLFRPIKSLFSPARQLSPASSSPPYSTPSPPSPEHHHDRGEEEREGEEHFTPPSPIWWRRILQEVFSRYPPQYRHIRQVHGPRVTTHLFFQHQLLLGLTVCLLFVLIVILPVHITGTPPPTDDSWLARTAVVMVAENPDRLVAHVLSSFFIVATLLFILYRFHTSPAVAYPILPSQGAPRPCDRSVCVTHLPPSTTEASLSRLFQQWYPGEIETVCIPPKTTSAFLDAEDQWEKADGKLRDLGVVGPDSDGSGDNDDANTANGDGGDVDQSCDYGSDHSNNAGNDNDNDNDNDNNDRRDSRTQDDNITQHLDNDRSTAATDQRVWIRQGWRLRRVPAIEHWQRKKREAEETLERLRREYTKGEEERNGSISLGGRGYVTFWSVEMAERCVKEHGVTVIGEASSIVRSAKDRSRDLITTDLLRRGRSPTSHDNLSNEDRPDTDMKEDPSFSDIDIESDSHQDQDQDHDNHHNDNSNNDNNKNHHDVHGNPKQHTTAIKVRRAPQPWEIAWRNADSHVINRSARKAVVHIVIALFLIFFTTPTSLVSGVRVLLNTGPVSETISFVRDASASFGGDVLLDLIFQYLPTLLLVIFASLVPIAIKQLTLQEKYKQHSKAERVIFSRLYIYLVLSLLVLPSLLLTSMDVVIEWIVSGDYGDILERLFPPESGAFFLNILLQYTLLTVTLSLIRVVPLALFIFKWFRAKNDQEREDAYRVIVYDFSYEAAAMITVVGIAITYSVFAPLTLVAGVVYLTYRHAVDRYILLHVCHKHPDKPHERVPHAAAYNKWLELLVRFMAINLVIFVTGLVLYFSTSIAGKALYVPHFILEVILLGVLITAIVLWKLYTKRQHPIVGGIRDNGARKWHIRKWKETKVSSSSDQETYWPFDTNADIRKNS